MAIIVTGGAGFIGSNLLDKLIERHPDTPLVVLDALIYPLAEKNISEKVRNHPHFRLIRGSVADTALLDTLFTGDDLVLHMAVEMGRTELFIETQLGGTRNLLEAAIRHKCRRFVYQSTSDVYGHNDSDDILETDPICPTHLYSATKLGAEALVMSYHYTHGLPMTILRPVSIYGPRQYPGWLIARFCNFALQGIPLPVQGTGEVRRDWIHVDDICEVLLAAMDITKPVNGQVMNVGTGREWSVMQIAQMALKLAGQKEDLLERKPAREGDFKRQITKAAKAKKLLGWSAKIPFEQGLQSTMEWYRANQDWVKAQTAKDGDRLGFRVK